MSENNILSKLESMMPFFSNTEKKLGNFILAQPQEILNMSTSEIAQQSQVSEATVIRFTRKLGLNGYTDFKLTLSANLNNSNLNQSIITDMSAKDSPLDIYKKLSAFTIASIKSTEETLNDKELINAVELIHSTHRNQARIYLTGVGASSTLAMQMQVKLMRLNMNSTFFEDSHLQLESLTNITENDLLICFTTLGKSIQAYQYVEIANKKKAKVILITQFGNQKLSSKTDVTLYISSIENNLRLASQTAITVQSMVIDTLFLALALKDLNGITNDVKITNEIFKDFGYYMNS
ncbi:RpiR family transcriptional regulator [Erysipelotrichaceae bacterium MTC7]|nr:RpiR family transcriptional regulator [Erysipelotrichaceae bacterium MTC7]